MKTIKCVMFLALFMIVVSCGTTVKFPVSQVAPAAEGTAKITKDKNNNYLIDLNIKYLTNPDRLTPARQYYVVWVETDGGLTKNIGRLVSNKSNRASLKTSIPFRPSQIFLTAEDDGAVTWPGNQEIFRSDHFNVK